MSDYCHGCDVRLPKRHMPSGLCENCLEAIREYATLRNKIERQDAALERLPERAEAAESAVDVLEKEATALRAEIEREKALRQDSDQMTDVWRGKYNDIRVCMMETADNNARLTAHLAAERERCAGLEGKFFRDVVCGRNCTCVGKPAEEMCLPEVTLTEVIAFFRALPAPEAT